MATLITSILRFFHNQYSCKLIKSNCKKIAPYPPRPLKIIAKPTINCSIISKWRACQFMVWNDGGDKRTMSLPGECLFSGGEDAVADLGWVPRHVMLYLHCVIL